MPSALPHSSTAREVRGRVLRSHGRLWRVEDFAGSPAATNSELRRLVAGGELVRVRRGVYWRGRRSRFGMTGVSSGQAVRELLGSHEAVGATGWYATKLLGLSTQVSPVETLAVTGRPPEGLRDVRVVSRAGRSGRREARLNDFEVTFLEALEGWERYVEADGETALARFVELLATEGMRVDRVLRASATEPPAVRERLRAVLERAGRKRETQRVRPARDARTRERALRVLSGVA